MTTKTETQLSNIFDHCNAFMHYCPGHSLAAKVVKHLMFTSQQEMTIQSWDVAWSAYVDLIIEVGQTNEEERLMLERYAKEHKGAN